MVYVVLNNTDMLYAFVSVYNSVHQVWAPCATWWVSYKKQEQLILREHLGSPPVFGVGSMLFIFFVSCVELFGFFLCFFCLRPVCCVPNVTSLYLSSSCVLCAHPFLIVFVLCVVCPMLPVSVLSILDCLRPVCCVPNVTSVYIVHS